MSPMELTSSRSLIVLRLSSALAALLTLIQAVLVILTAAKVAKLIAVHGGVGYLSLLAMITATIAASLNAKLSFLGQVFRFNPAGDVAVLPIHNLEMRRPEAG